MSLHKNTRTHLHMLSTCSEFNHRKETLKRLSSPGGPWTHHMQTAQHRDNGHMTKKVTRHTEDITETTGPLWGYKSPHRDTECTTEAEIQFTRHKGEIKCMADTKSKIKRTTKALMTNTCDTDRACGLTKTIYVNPNLINRIILYVH